MEDNLILAYQDKAEFNKNLDLDFIITKFKVKLGERFIYLFEDYGIISETWRKGKRYIILDEIDPET